MPSHDAPAARISRRCFGAAAGTAVLASAIPARAQSDAAAAVAPEEMPKRLRKAVKWGMIDADGPAVGRFRLCKELGYDGIELVSPDAPPAQELRAASAETGMPIHGLVNNRHWQVRMSAPDQATRDQARAIQEQAIRDCAAMGGHAVLLVPGVVGGDATHDEVWSRSIAEIRKSLPLCAALGVRVLIENVWNGFCETPERYRDYLDEIDSPWVGAYFDIGNCRKFGLSEDWIRTLGSRIVKLDVKDWGESAGFCKIGDGDVNWPAVREALDGVGFAGWCTAEVAGGGRERLSDIARRMDAVLLG